ncbi:MAG: cyclic nucleotide-binding domain-containing protein [Treponema sp.]|jgi:voltage-gated potassium channel|nr:cyclic nucleotide-binding domain-containing protein [Treponema sp.]
MNKATYVGIVIGNLMIILLSLDSCYVAAARLIETVLWVCLTFFTFEWAMHILHAIRKKCTLVYLFSTKGIVDAISVLAIPVALIAGLNSRTAWLLAVFWTVKVISRFNGLKKLRRVLVMEAGPLLSVLVMFLLVLFLSSAVLYVLERDAQPDAFGSLPAAMWWAVATLTTTGYGDVVPVTQLGRIVAGFVMICGLAVFGLWTGILATAFASELRRESFLKTWETVSKVPFFADLGPTVIADVTQMLRILELPPHAMVFRQGEPADSMYFITSGEVEVELPGKKILLGEGAFFGEMALLGNQVRSANIATTKFSKLLVLDLADFRLLMARNPDLSQTIDAEAKRRMQENLERWR